MLHSSTLSGILPTICAASVWKKTLRLRHSAPISARGCRTPISLLTAMMLTMDVSGVMAASSAARSTSPFFDTGRYVTRKPSCSSARQLSSTHLCSVVVVMMCFFFSLWVGGGGGSG